MIDRIDVEFSALDGTKLSAWLYRPVERLKPLPAVTPQGAAGGQR